MDTISEPLDKGSLITESTLNIDRELIKANPNVELLWQACVKQLQNGSTELVFNDKEPVKFTLEEVKYISERFEKLTGFDAFVSFDHKNSSVRIYNDSFTSDQVLNSHDIIPFLRNPKAKVARERQDKVPRPPNAFILYRQAHHNHVKFANPDFHNNQISQIIGKMWKSEDQPIKDMFKQRATQIAFVHKQMHPEYQYSPRKADSKGRRQRKSALRPTMPHVTLNINQNDTVPDFTNKVPSPYETFNYELNANSIASYKAMIPKHNNTMMQNYPTIGTTASNSAVMTIRSGDTAENRSADEAACDFTSLFRSPGAHAEFSAKYLTSDEQKSILDSAETEDSYIDEDFMPNVSDPELPSNAMNNLWSDPELQYPILNGANNNNVGETNDLNNFGFI